MKVLNINQSVKEFNDLLREGIEHGFILNKVEDNQVLIELCANLIFYLKYFVIASNAKEEV